MNRAYIYIIIAAILWGTISFYVKFLYTYGFTPMEVVTLRVWTASILLVTYLWIKSPKDLKLASLLDLKFFIGTGICSIVFFNYCMFKTMELTTIPISAALLYTAPAFVIIISYFLFQESITLYKMIAFIMTLIGTGLVIGLSPLEMKIIPYTTILIGLGSGLGYALYSIFSKFALKRYSSLTVTTYTFVVASIALIPFFPYQNKMMLLLETKVLLFSFGLGFLPTAVAYIVYTVGLHKVEASNAAILTTIEPVVASIIGVSVFLEPFTIIQIMGMGFTISAVILIQLDNKRNKYIQMDDAS